MKIYDNFFKAQKGIAIAIGVIALLWVPCSLAQTYSADDLTRLVSGWAVQQTQHVEQASIEVFALDSRLPPKDCSVDLELSWVNPTLQAQNSVKVLCQGDQHWQLYVNVKLSQQVDVVVSQRQLASGTYLSNEDIQIQLRDVRQARGQYLTDPAPIVGARLKRSVIVGQLLKLSDFCLVCKGDQVTIEGISGTLAVSTTGKALSDATLGETVRVQNTKSGRVIEAQVTAVKKVTINL